MAKNDNLKDFLTDVADAIREKKGTTDKINPQDFSSEIASVQSGDRDWGEIGYDAEPTFIEEGFAYAKEIKDNWNPNVSSILNKFRNDTKIAYFPLVDTSNIQDFSNAFYMSTLEYIPQLNYSKATKMPNYFYYCGSLREISLKGTSNVTSYNTTFNSCTLLKIIHEIDFFSATDVNGVFYNCKTLSFAKILNLGKSSLATYDFSGATNWGVATTDIPDAKQSLIDSLITYSYDRASNGMSTATIKLSATTKALLTEEEIAQITNKGFTIA
jgi:hypothetical protein